MLSRRQFNHGLPAALVATGSLAGCTSGGDDASYESAV
jgi:hypothetical protein